MNSYQMALDLLERFGNMSGEPLLSIMMTEIFPERMCLVSSFGTESALLLAMVAHIDPEFPVIFIDTKRLFPETLAYRDTLIEHLGLQNVQTYYPDYIDTTRNDAKNTLFETDPNNCCFIRKGKPLDRALEGYDAWITGRKRFHGGIRKNIPLIESMNGSIKINPLATFSIDEIQREFKSRKLPEHPLIENGYTSVGCVPCTSLPSSSSDIRSGRWQGQDKTECGIHVGEDGKFSRDSG